ncbi:MAG TPA: M64 family metallopeptidase [Myxococcota bacterium]|nr:M64 family metallopeptidase [Myxococcota bacterium]
MSRPRAALAACLVSLGLALSAAAYDVETVQTSGDSANRIDLVILGDGYRVEDQAKLTSDVQSFLTRFWQQTPYAEYRNFFNVKLIHVISNENGADNGSYGAVRDTALGAYYNCYNIDRLICLDTWAVYQAANADAPEWDFLFVMVNDPKYGGSGGSISVFSVHALAGDIAIHEFGHSFGGLADEYEDAYPGYPGCGSDCPEPNVTTRTVREEVKWNPWIDAATPVPTPETGTYWDAVGVFEGARYQTTGVFRPKQACFMRQYGVPFCEVCEEALVLSVYQQVSPLDSASPAGPVSLGSCDLASFEVAYPRPVPDTVEVTWRVDGQVVQTGGAGFELDASGLSIGAHQLEAEIADLTPLVRTDPSSLLVERQIWTVQVTGTPVCLIGGECIPDGTLNPANPCEICQAASQPGAWSPLSGVACGDGLYCNGAEACQAGACQAGAAPCQDDGLACTLTCDEAGQRCNLPQAGWCAIAGVCRTAGEAEPGNPCRTCQPGVDPSAWVPDDSATCGDGEFCDGPETCQGGVCQAGAAPCQDDGLACTDTCDEAGQRCDVPQAGWCAIAGVCATAGEAEPGNPCRTCQPGLDPLAWTADDGRACEDGLYCNGAETCLAGACQAGAAPCQDDGLACTDTCDEAGQRCDVPQAGWCAIAGVCATAGEAEPGNPCRTCQPGLDPLAWSPDDTAGCDDARPCTTSDHCQAGACVGQLSPGCCTVAADCDDGLACTQDACDAGQSACSSSLSAGACLVDGVCALAGEASPGNACLTCQPGTAPRAWTSAEGAACDDGDPCTAGGACLAGACAPGERLCDPSCPCEEPAMKGGCGCGAGTGQAPGALLSVLLGWLWVRRRPRA